VPTLTEVMNKQDADKNEKGHDYITMYEFWLADKSKIKTLLEIGFGTGNSARTWREYFPDAQIYMMELFGKEFSETWRSPNTNISGINIIEGDATKVETWDNVPDNLDIIIDDASHYPNDQIATFMIAFRKLRSRGVYFIEDTYCNFVKEYSNNDVLYTWLFKLIMEQECPPDGKMFESRGFNTNRKFMTYPVCDIYSYHIYKNVLCFEKA
jgi:hypothetical protein